MASGIDALGEGLRQGGSLDAVGEFSLDADKARDKLRRFQLAVPQHYVLLLVQAAVLRGATAIDFTIDGDDVWMRADGRPFTEAELRDVYGAIFSERRDADHLARHYLALGVNAAMSLSPRHVRVLSGDAALTLREGRPDELGPRDEGAAAVTEIHVRDRLHPRILVQMWKRGESDVLRARCHLSDVPITVNGAPVQRGLALPERVRCVESVDLDHGRAHVGVDDHRRPAAAQITTAGVWIAAHPIPLPRGFVAHVRADRLAKDVSQGDVVRDADYAAVAAAVEAAGLRSLAHLVDLALAGDFRGYAVGDLVTWLFDQASAELPAALRAAPGRYPPARLPIWQTLGGARLTTLDLAAADRLRVVDARPSLMLPEFADILLVERVTGDAAGGDGVDPSAFLHITFAGRVESGDAAVARAIAREHGRRRFLARPHPPRLEDGAYLERLSFGEGTSVRGEVGLRAAGSVRPTLLLLLDGCILEEVALPGPMPGLVAVVAAPAHPDEDYTRAARLSSLAGAFLQILAVTERLVASAALHLGPDIQGRPLVREQLLDYVQASLSPTFVEDFLVGVGFARPLARDVVSHLEGGALRPAWGLGDGGVPHPLAGLRVFPVQGGEPLALADLAGIHRRGEPLWWLPAPADDVDRPVLILDPRLRAWIEAALPRSSLSSYVPHLDRLRKERALLGRPPDAIETAPTLVHAPLRHGRIHGTLGVEASAPRSREVVSGHECHVRIFKRSRHLHDASLTTLLPHVIAAANDDDAEVGRREVPPAIVDAVDAALPQLVLAAAHLAAAHLAAAATARAPSLAPPLAPSLRALLLALPTAVYPRPELFEAHLRLIRERGSEGAAAPFAALVAGSARHPPEQLRAPLRRALAAAAPLDVDAVLAELGSPSLAAKHERLAALRLALLVALPAVLALPLVPAAAGPTDLARVLALARERGPLDVVDEGTPLDGYTDHEGPLLLLDPSLRALLVALLGASRLRDGAPLLERHRARQRFAARPRAAAIALDPRASLVKLAFPDGEITGEIGLARVRPGDPPRVAIHVHRDHRRVTTLGGDDLALPLLAALEVPDAELDAACTGLTKRGARDVLAFCKRQIDPLLHHLALSYQTLPLADQPLAAAWLRDRLAQRVNVGGVASPSALKKLRRDPFALAVLDLPLLRHVSGEPRTLAEAIATYHEEQVLRYSREPHPDLGDALLVTPEEDPLIEALFPVRFDAGAERQRGADARARRDRAPRLAADPPADAIAHRELDGELRGALWIAPSADGSPSLDAVVALGADGHEAGRVVLVDHLACGGALSGRGVVITPEWDGAHLDRKHLRRARRAALGLWGGLVAEYRRGLGALDRLLVEPDALARLARVRDALWIQLLALHRASLGGKLSAGARELLEDLLELPLLPLANERLVSLSLALREQPAELVFLGLWEPPSSPAPSEPEPPPPAGSASAPPPRPLPPDVSPSTEPEPLDLPPLDPSPAAPPPREPTPEERLLEALRAELRCVRGPHEGALTDSHLASLVVGSGSGRQVAEETDRFFVIDLAHPLTRAARDRGAREPLLLSMLASAVYTYLNVRLAEIEDHDEAAFHGAHARHLLSGALGGRPPP